ncbi:MAG TPA: Lrp/AsnC family transcriptional regulator [Candidatus Thermoplasmatota archaeon]|nr:Lrp/AsnC family transcriptional regulator [Candidatus Thermoplasmatota archaeon]
MKTTPKRIIEQLSQDEVQILTALQKNSKDSVSSIAKYCGFSRQKVKRILTRLENDNVIWGYTAIIDEKKQGLLKYVLLIRRSMDKIDKNTAEKITFQIYDEDYEKLGITIESWYLIHGEYDWMIIFTSQNLRDAKKFSTLLIEKYPNIIVKINLMQILHSPKTHHIISPTPESLLDFL